MKKVANVVMVEGLLKKHPELVKIIEKEYGAITVFENGSMHLILSRGKVDSNNLSIVVCYDGFLVDAFDVYKFVNYLGAASVSNLSSLILVKPMIDKETGFEPEITSLREISFGEVALPKNEEKKTIISIREIPVAHDDFYEKHDSDR